MRSSKLALKNSNAFKAINFSPTNNSKSKQTFSFGRTSRFTTQTAICPQNSYGGETIRSRNKGASIGYGIKSDFTKVLTSSPGSSKYHLKTNFEISKQKMKGYQLGEGRQKIIYQSYVDRELCKTPSVDRYQTISVTKLKSPMYSIRARTKVHNKSMTIEAQNRNPGPGSYQNPENNQPKSQYIISKFPKISYGTGRQKRFSISDNKIPGPATYEQISNLSNTGRYILSSQKGGTNAKFDRNKRKTKFDEAAKKSLQYPGPGNYQLPSQFGQYDGDIYQSFSTVRAL